MAIRGCDAGGRCHMAKTVVWGGGGCVASRGCDAGGIGVIWLRRLFGVEEDVWLAGDVMLGKRCQMARRVVGAGGRMCG